MDALFWLSVTVVLYVYVGYPAFLAAWARTVDRRPRAREFEAGHWPSISIIVAATLAPYSTQIQLIELLRGRQHFAALRRGRGVWR